MVTTLALNSLLAPCAGEAGAVDRPDGTRLHVLTAGDGPTVLLVHGFGVSVDEWNLVQPALVDRGRRVIAYDHRGHGRSTIGSDGLTSSALFADLTAVLESQETEDAVMVCHSMGNFVALGALGREPALQRRLRALICVAPAMGQATKGAPAARLQVPLVRLGILQRLARNPALGRTLARKNLGPRASSAVVEATRRMLVEMPRHLAPLAGVLARESIASILPGIALPVRVLAGDADALTPPWHAQLIVDRGRQAEISTLPGIGHMVNWEDPDAIVAAVAS